MKAGLASARKRQERKNNTNYTLYACGGVGIIAVGGIIYYFFKHKKEPEPKKEPEKEPKKESGSNKYMW